MAQFTNQAQLSYNNGIVNSNVAVGEILEVLSASKTAVSEDYGRNDNITYVISIVNSGNTPLSGLQIVDDLGGYSFESDILYPLAYVEGSLRVYVNGVLQSTAPTVEGSPPLTISGLSVPANGNVILIYETEVTVFAPLDVDGAIVNTAVINGTALPTPITVSEEIETEQEPELTITKLIDPVVVPENGSVTYTFLIQNFGNTPATAEDNVRLTDTFDPILSDLSVTFNGTPWTGTQYSYFQNTGLFVTTPGQITVPAATYTQDEATGTWIVTPGVSTLTVTGTL